MAARKKRTAPVSDLGSMYRRPAADAEHLTAAEAVGVANRSEPRGRRRPGPAPDPAKKALRSYLFRLRPEHADALKRAAGTRVAEGRAKRFDSAEVLRLLLDKWLGQGAKAP